MNFRPKVQVSIPLLPAICTLVFFSLVIGIAFFFFFQSDVDNGLNELRSVYRYQRPSEARLTALGYAPFINIRGPGKDPIDETTRSRAALPLLEADKALGNAKSKHALGLYYLTEKNFARSIELLSEAAELEPNNAATRSDLGAAYIERAASSSTISNLGDLARGLEQVSLAIQRDGSLMAAHFNRALCIELMGASTIAQEAWEDYHQKDRDSGWGNEATKHLQFLRSRQSNNKPPPEILSDFLTAYHRGDEAEAWRIESQTKEMITGAMIPFQLLRDLLADILNDQRGRAFEMRGAAKFLGQIEERHAGDWFFAELAAYYSQIGKKSAADLQLANEATLNGYSLCLKGRYSDALVVFGKASRLYQTNGDTWDKQIVDYWLAYCLCQQREWEKSSQILLVLARNSHGRSYPWLESQSYYWLGVNSIALSQYSLGDEYTRKALKIATKIGDSYNCQKICSQLAQNAYSLGRLDDALNYNQQSLPMSEAYFASDRQYWRNLDTITDNLFALHLFAGAEVYQREALNFTQLSNRDPVLAHSTYIRLSQVYAEEKKYSASERSIKQSLEVIKPIETDASTQTLRGLSALFSATLRRDEGDCASALRYAQEAIERFDSAGLDSYYSYSGHKEALMCHLQGRDKLAIEKEIATVLRLFEQHRQKIKEEQNRNHFFDSEQSIYDLAIDYAYRSMDHDRGFDYAEMSKGRSLLDAMATGAAPTQGTAAPDVILEAGAKPLGIAQMGKDLPEDLQIVEYAVLQNRLLIWLITNDIQEVIGQSIPLDRLSAITSEYLRVLPLADDSSIKREQELATQLHDWLLAPIESRLDKTRTVALVPDKFLSTIPFAALLSSRTHRRMISDYAVLYAPSANVLIECSKVAGKMAQPKTSERLLSVGDPAFSPERHSGLRRLTAAGGEAEAIAAFYENKRVLVGENAVKGSVESELDKADVINFATHYLTNNVYPARSTLVLAASFGGRDNLGEDDLTLQEIQTRRLRKTKLVVLSACESGVQQYYAGEGPIGLSRAFLAAGTPLVIASQWSVESDSAADLMINFHRLRKQAQNLSSIQALRLAQLDMLNNKDERFRRPYYWAAFFLTGGHASY